MAFVDFDICHRLASLRKLHSMILTCICDFKCLKYLKFVRFHMLPDNKIKKNNQQYILKHLVSNFVSPVFFSSVISTYIFDFRCLKGDMRLYSYVSRSKNYEKNQHHNQTFTIERYKSCFSPP